jgi:class 3 adenylate cyclase
MTPERLRAYDEHIEQHGCGCPGFIGDGFMWGLGEPCTQHAEHLPGGTADCPDAQRLLAELTPTERAEYDARPRLSFG